MNFQKLAILWLRYRALEEESKHLIAKDVVRRILPFKSLLTGIEKSSRKMKIKSFKPLRRVMNKVRSIRKLFGIKK